MLTAATHMLDSSPWRQGLPPPPPPPPTTTATLHHLHTTGRRIAKRRPRPSRRLPTTYISADPANFRRMVHQITGADDLLSPPPPSLSSPPELLRPLPDTAGCSAGSGAALMLPTLDTSAFLLGLRAGPAALTEAVAPPCDGSPALIGGGGAANYSSNYSNNNSSSSSSGGNCGGGFPSLDSWDLL